MMATAIVAAGLTFLFAAAAAELPALDAYVAAAGRGETGIVDGRTYTERRRPAGPDTPIPGLAVALVPYSDALMSEVEGIKAHARDSMHAYRSAAGQVRRTLEGYAKAVHDAGGARLAPSSPTGADGRFSFPEVPAGQWLLLAAHEVTTAVKPREPKREAANRFALTPSLVGYRTVSFWILPVSVTGGGTTIVEVTDRKVWFTGVIEERRK